MNIPEYLRRRNSGEQKTLSRSLQNFSGLQSPAQVTIEAQTPTEIPGLSGLFPGGTPGTKTNYARGASNYLLSQGGPFTGLAGMLVGMKADKVAKDNQEIAQKAAAEQALGEKVINWAREDENIEDARDFDLKKLGLQQGFDTQKQDSSQEHDWLKFYTANNNDIESKNIDLKNALIKHGVESGYNFDNDTSSDTQKLIQGLAKYKKENSESSKALAQKTQEDSYQNALQGINDLQDIATDDNIGAFTRWRHSMNMSSDKQDNNLGKLSAAVAAIAPASIQKLKNAGVSGVNTMAEFLTYVGLPENPTSKQIGGALPTINKILGIRSEDRRSKSQYGNLSDDDLKAGI